MAGTFGYELDVTKLTAEEKAEIKEQISTFHQFYDLIQYGDYYRLLSPEGGCSVWEFVSPNRSEALVSGTYNHVQSNASVLQVKVRGLEDGSLYRVEPCGAKAISMKIFPLLEQGMVISGAALQNGGLPVPPAHQDYQCWQYHITRCEGGQDGKAVSD